MKALAPCCAAALLGAGCSSPPGRYWVVEWQDPAPAAGALRVAESDIAVVVGEILAGPTYRQRQLVVRRPPDEVTYHHRWALPPSENVRRFLLDGLRARGLFREVVADQSLLSDRDGPFRVLRGELVRYELVVTGAPGGRLEWTAQVELQLVARDEQGRAWLSGAYEGSRAVGPESRSMAGVVAALREILTDVVTRIERDLLERDPVAAMVGPPPPGAR